MITNPREYPVVITGSASRVVLGVARAPLRARGKTTHGGAQGQARTLKGGSHFCSQKQPRSPKEHLKCLVGGGPPGIPLASLRPCRKVHFKYLLGVIPAWELNGHSGSQGVLPANPKRLLVCLYDKHPVRGIAGYVDEENIPLELTGGNLTDHWDSHVDVYK